VVLRAAFAGCFGVLMALAPVPAEKFKVLPEADSQFAGSPGGPFQPPDHAFILQNDGEDAISWSVSATRDWLSFAGPTSGVVPAHDSALVAVGIGAAAAALPAGSHTALVRFSLSGPLSFIETRRVVLDVSGETGWTIFTASPDTRKIYVSSSRGDDGNNGLGPATAKRTLAAGIAMLRDGYPDWLLLERGDAWNEGLGHWMLSGRSPSEPMLVSTYGGALERPLLQSGTQDGVCTQPGGGSPPRIDDVAFVGLHFLADGYRGVTDQVGARMLQPGSHLLFEDCEFEGYAVNLVFQGYGGRHSDFRLRRSVIVDAYATHANGHSQGLYAYAVDGLLIEDNVFDHNGWNESVAEAGPDIFNHNLYIDNDNTAVVVRDNIIANAASHGMQLRPGGVCVDNLFVRNSIALQVGGGNHPDPGGVNAEVHDNVILDGKNIDASNPRGWAMWFANVASGHVSGNVIAHNTVGSQPLALALDGHHSGDSTDSVGVHDLLIENNVIYDWGGKLYFEGDAGELTRIALSDNDLQAHAGLEPLVDFDDGAAVPSVRWTRNRFFSWLSADDAWFQVDHAGVATTAWEQLTHDATATFQPVDYPDAHRSLASYSEACGHPGTYADFIEAARRQSRESWQPSFTAAAVNRYIRAGFGR